MTGITNYEMGELGSSCVSSALTTRYSQLHLTSDTCMPTLTIFPIAWNSPLDFDRCYTDNFETIFSDFAADADLVEGDTAIVGFTKVVYSLQ